MKGKDLSLVESKQETAVSRVRSSISSWANKGAFDKGSAIVLAFPGSQDPLKELGLIIHKDVEALD